MKFRFSLIAAGIAAVTLGLPAQAQFTERTIRLSNGVNQEHPVGNGVAKISMKDLMGGLWPFLWAELIVLFLLVLFPDLVLVPLRWLS